MKFSTTMKIKISFLFITTLLIFLSWFSSINIITRDLSYGDEGVVAQTAFRVLNGEVPFRDFFLISTPGSAYYHAIFLGAFGSNLLSLRIGLVTCLFLIYAGGMWALWLIGVRQLKIYIFLAFFLSYFGGTTWFIASYHWLAQVFCILSLVFLLSEKDSNQNLWKTFISGILALLVVFTLQHNGVLWTLAVAISFLFLSPPARKKRFKWFFAGWLVVAVPLAVYFLYYVGYDTLYDQLISFPLNNYKIHPAHQGTFSKDFFDSWTRLNSSPTSFSVNTFYSLIDFVTIFSVYIVPFAGLFALICLYLKKSISYEVKNLLSAYFFASYISVIHRPSASALIFLSSAALLPIFLLLEQLINSSRQKYRHVLTIFVFIVFSIIPCMSMTKFYFNNDSILIQTKAGKLAYPDSNEAYSMLSIYNKYMSLRKDGDEIFCYRYLPMFYFITGETNRTPFDVLIHPMNSQKQLDITQSILEERKVRFILFGNGQFNTDSLGEYIRKNYKYVIKKPYEGLLERI